jgi:uncharacterized membrane protein YphA (DoxX/SURF4 family)
MPITKQQLWDYAILAARVLIAWTFLSYGWGKLTGTQFGISPEEMATPVKDLSLFRLAWHLFNHEPFNTFVGISQLIVALLLLINRTAILGALLAIPILANILVIDITYLKMPGFYWRLSYYLLLIFLILWHYKKRLFAAFETLTNGVSTKFKFPVWAYLILPIAAISLEVFGVIPKVIIGLLLHPAQTIESMKKMPAWIIEMLGKLFG